MSPGREDRKASSGPGDVLSSPLEKTKPFDRMNDRRAYTQSIRLACRYARHRCIKIPAGILTSSAISSMSYVIRLKPYLTTYDLLLMTSVTVARLPAIFTPAPNPTSLLYQVTLRMQVLCPERCVPGFGRFPLTDMGTIYLLKRTVDQRVRSTPRASRPCAKKSTAE